MKKNSRFYKILILIFCFSNLFFARAQTDGTGGFEKCSLLLNELAALRTHPQIQSIVFNESNSFPYNIIVTFPPKRNAKQTKKSTNENLLTTLIIALKTEDFYDKPETLEKIVKNIRDAQRLNKILLVFTYGDEFSTSERNRITGSEVFCENLSDAVQTCTICIRFGEKNAVIPGTAKETSPTMLSKLASEAFRKTEEEYEVQGGLVTFLYRNGFLKSDERSSLYSETGSRTITVQFSKYMKLEEKLPEYFRHIAEDCNLEKISVSDSHSNQGAITSVFLYTSEKLSVILFIIIMALSLFALSELSFLNKKTSRELSKALTRLWYLIPVSFISTAIAFFVSQSITILFYNLFSINIYVQIALKLVLGFVLGSIIFFLIFKLQGIFIANAYSYLLTLSGMINLIIFTSLDISLLYVFSLEYILIYLSRPHKHTMSLIVFFLLLFVPFAPYAIQIIKYTEPQALSLSIKSGFLMNSLFSVFLMPFEFQWLRIIVRMNERWKTASKKTKKFYMQNTITVFASLSIFLVIILTMDFFIPQKYKEQTRKNGQTFIEKGNDNELSLSLVEEEHFGETTRILNIKTKRQPKSISVIVEGEENSSVIYSDNDLLQDKANKTDYFRLPLYPPKEITFRYIAKANENSVIKVSAVIPEKEENIWSFVKKELFVPKRKK